MQMLKLDNQTIQLALAAVIGLAVLLQTIILMSLAITMRKAARAIREEIVNLRASLMPVIFDAREILASSRDTLVSTQEVVANVQGFITRVSPKVEEAAGDVAEIARGLKEQTAQMQSSVQEIMERVKRQSGRVDGMFTGALDTVDRAGVFMNDVVTKPMRQISHILAFVKAAVESLRASGALSR